MFPGARYPMRILVYSLFVALLADASHAFVPQRLSFQHAGDIGKYSLGAGYQFSYYHLNFFWGYVPESAFNNHYEIFTIKNDFDFFHYNHQNFEATFYGGIGLSHLMADRYNTQRISGAPDDYYRIGNLKGQLYLGGRSKFYKKYSYYMESSINDVWLVNMINNNQTVKIQDHLVLALGIHISTDVFKSNEKAARQD